MADNYKWTNFCPIAQSICINGIISIDRFENMQWSILENTIESLKEKIPVENRAKCIHWNDTDNSCQLWS